MTETRTVDELDRIDRSIEIDAPATKVWGLVSRPGWWINTSAIVQNLDVVPDPDRDGVHVVRDPQYGDFRIRTVDLDEPRYAAFRWLGEGAGDDGGGGPSTLVELFLEDRPGGVTLRVVESGFSTLSDDRATWLAEREGNVEGWGVELAAARDHFDQRVVQRSVRLPLPPQEVWPLLTEGRHLREWYAPGGAEVEAHEGGRMELLWPEHGRFRADVVRVEEPTTFGFRLCHVPDAEPEPGTSTLETFTVTPVPTQAGGEHSVVTVRAEGCRDLDPSLSVAATLYDDEVQGWETALSELERLVRGAPAEPVTAGDAR